MSKCRNRQPQFSVLDLNGDGYMYLETWISLMKVARPDLSTVHATALFRALDCKNNERLDQDEFQNVCEYLEVVIKKHWWNPPPNWVSPEVRQSTTVVNLKSWLQWFLLLPVSRRY